MRVAALIRLDEGIVFVRHRAGARTYHLLPGGGVAYRETLREALAREVAEETGLEIDVGPLAFVNDTIDPDGPRHVVNITFLARVTGGIITETPDDPRVEAVDIMPPDAIRGLDLRPPVAEAILETLSDPQRGMPGYLGSLFTPGR